MMMVVRIRRPEGAEMDDQEVSEEDLAALRGLFDDVVDGDGVEGKGRMSAVDGYIQGVREGNPIVELGKTKLLYP
jgi:hypothetical protein